MRNHAHCPTQDEVNLQSWGWNACRSGRGAGKKTGRIAAAVVLNLLAEAINLTRAKRDRSWLLGDPASYRTSALRQKQSYRG